MNTVNGVELATLAGVTYRRVDHWTRRGWLRTLDGAPGPGNAREYARSEVVVARAIGELTHAGVVVDVAARVARGDVEARAALRRALELAESPSSPGARRVALDDDGDAWDELDDVDERGHPIFRLRDPDGDGNELTLGQVDTSYGLVFVGPASLVRDAGVMRPIASEGTRS